MSFSRLVDNKAVVHLHNGILHSSEKGGTLTVCDSMNGPGEYCAKCNKLVSERQIPYDLTCKKNLMSKIN